jgi:hypothetical protein
MLERIVPVEGLKPKDDPPSYQESVLSAESSFTSSNHRKKAEYPPFIITRSVLRLKLFFKDILDVPGVSARSHLNPARVRESTDNLYATERTIRVYPALLQTSRRGSAHFRDDAATEISQEAVPPDKNSIY